MFLEQQHLLHFRCVARAGRLVHLAGSLFWMRCPRAASPALLLPVLSVEEPEDNPRGLLSGESIFFGAESSVPSALHASGTQHSLWTSQPSVQEDRSTAQNLWVRTSHPAPLPTAALAGRTHRCPQAEVPRDAPSKQPGGHIW